MKKRMRQIGLLVMTSIIFLTVPVFANTIKIGVTIPLTGFAATYGEDAKRGVEIAIAEANAMGGINGNKIEAIYEDDGGVGKMGMAATRKLITIDKVPVILAANGNHG